VVCEPSNSWVMIGSMPSPTDNCSISQSNLRLIVALREEITRIESAIRRKLEAGSIIEHGPLIAQIVDGSLVVTNGVLRAKH